MSLPQYVTNVSSFEDTVKILKNKGILTEADIKEGIGMFLDPIGYKKSEVSDIDKMFTKKFTGTSDKPGHSGYMYDIYKNGKIVKTGIEGEGNANAWINVQIKKPSINEEYGMSLEDAKAEAQRESEEDGVSVHINSVGKGRYQVSYWYDSDSTVASYDGGILTNEYDEYSDEDNDEYFFDVNAEELDETDIYGIAGNPEEEEIAKSARIPNKNISNEDKFDIIKRDGSKIQGVQFFKNGEWYKDTEKGGRHLGGKVPEGSKVVKSSMNELDETDIYGIAGNPEEEASAKSARLHNKDVM